jgi:hypothetical protein
MSSPSPAAARHPPNPLTGNTPRDRIKTADRHDTAAASSCRLPCQYAIAMKRLLYLGPLLLLCPNTVPAQDHALFITSDLNPFIQIYSLPSPAEHPAPAEGRWSWRYAMDIASNAIQDELDDGQRILLSGETYRTSVAFAYGVTDRWTAELLVPLVAHCGGMLDGPIREWHGLFGFSNRRREALRGHGFSYLYAVSGMEQVALDERSRGLGDMRLTAEYRMRSMSDSERSLAVRAGLKLPTGSSAGLRGSGSTDFSLQLLSTDRQTLSAWNTTLSWMVGGLWLGESEVLEELRRDAVAIASIGVSRPAWRNWTLRLQIDGHSDFYHSALRPLGSRAIQLVLGGSYSLTRAGRIDFALVENVFTDTTPDLGIHIGWRAAR